MDQEEKTIEIKPLPEPEEPPKKKKGRPKTRVSATNGEEKHVLTNKRKEQLAYARAVKRKKREAEGKAQTQVQGKAELEQGYDYAGNIDNFPARATAPPVDYPQSNPRPYSYGGTQPATTGLQGEDRMARIENLLSQFLEMNGASRTGIQPRQEEQPPARKVSEHSSTSYNTNPFHAMALDKWSRRY